EPDAGADLGPDWRDGTGAVERVDRELAQVARIAQRVVITGKDIRGAGGTHLPHLVTEEECGVVAARRANGEGIEGGAIGQDHRRSAIMLVQVELQERVVVQLRVGAEALHQYGLGAGFGGGIESDLGGTPELLAAGSEASDVLTA